MNYMNEYVRCTACKKGKKNHHQHGFTICSDVSVHSVAVGGHQEMGTETVLKWGEGNVEQKKKKLWIMVIKANRSF